MVQYVDHVPDLVQLLPGKEVDDSALEARGTKVEDVRE
jgi:hypothetical protein